MGSENAVLAKWFSGYELCYLALNLGIKHSPPGSQLSTVTSQWQCVLFVQLYKMAALASPSPNPLWSSKPPTIFFCPSFLKKKIATPPTTFCMAVSVVFHYTGPSSLLFKFLLKKKKKKRKMKKKEKQQKKLSSTVPTQSESMFFSIHLRETRIASNMFS